MSRRIAVVLVVLALMAFFGVISAAETITEEDVFVSDPVGRYVLKGSESYLSVNIRNFLPESKLRLVISQKFSTVVNETALQNELPVNQLKLVAPKVTASDKRIVYQSSVEQSPEDISKDVYETVDKYFELRQLLQEIEKSAEKSAEKTVIRKEDFTKLMSEFLYWQSKYMLLFEKKVFADTIANPSYYVSLASFESGEYVARFLDDSGKLVKEVYIDVVNELPQPVTNVELIKNSATGVTAGDKK